MFPFKEDGIIKQDVFRILEESGLGLPDYYKWRTRSGCYFCFFQRKAEWIGLKNNHPDLFDKAQSYEKSTTPTGTRYTWQNGESLEEIAKREKQILKNYGEALKRWEETAPNRPLIQLFDDAHDDDDEMEPPCLICDL